MELINLQRTRRATLRNRRYEIEQCLADFDLLRGPRRLSRRTRVSSRDTPRSHRLRQALQALGPVFSALGLYLSSRIDMLPHDDCQALAAIPDAGNITPIDTVRNLFTQEIGDTLDRSYLTFEALPFETRRWFQSHRAVLHNGQAVVVKVAHPMPPEQLEYDLELLPALKPALTDPEWHTQLLDDALVDFRIVLQQQLSFSYVAKTFEELARDTQEFSILRVPIIYRDLSTSNLLTVDHLPGVAVGDLLSRSGQQGFGDEPVSYRLEEHLGIVPHDLARRLCMVWLRQALLGEAFPVDLQADHLSALPTKQIAIIGGAFARLPPEAKKNLWNYMLAIATDEPEKACTYLLREISPSEASFDEEELRYRFREVVPFRDRPGSGDQSHGALLDYLSVHWRLLNERGLHLPRHILGFYRGLRQTAAYAQQLAPGRDPLLEGLQDVRTISLLNQFQDMMGMNQFGENMGKHAAMMMGLPKQLNEALMLVNGTGITPRPKGISIDRHGRQRYSSAVVLALLLLLATVALLSHHLAASAVAGVWLERVSAVLFVLIGALVLRVISRN